MFVCNRQFFIDINFKYFFKNKFELSYPYFQISLPYDYYLNFTYI